MKFTTVLNKPKTINTYHIFKRKIPDHAALHVPNTKY
jgi:hypothetical protein